MKHSKQYTDKMKRWYGSSGWRVPRDAYKRYRISIDGGVCELCKSELGYIVDHIIELNEDNFNDINIRLSWDNLQYICHSCHNQKTFRKYSALDENYYITEDGDIAPINKL